MLCCITGVNCAVNLLIKRGNIGCEYKEHADLMERSSALLGELEGIINKNKNFLLDLF